MSETHTVSRRSLLLSTLLAGLFAAVMLVVVILPAEYNLDVTGLGHQLGLTTLASAGESAEMQTAQGDAEATVAGTKLVEQLTLAAGQGLEFKVQMDQHAKARYQWMSFGAPVHFDHHGEPAGDTTGYFESYALGEASAMEGNFTTPFAGTHGWYWENRSDTEVTVQLVVEGELSEL